MAHPILTRADTGDDDLSAALDRCARVAKVLVFATVGLAALYFSVLFALSR